MKRYFVTAIGTDSGKTLVSAILCEALNADYWKPIQSGLPRDTETVQSLVTNTITQFHPERYLLNTPASPHASAKIDKVNIRLDDFTIPSSSNHIIIEGAGGCLVPINDDDFVIDLAKKFQSRVILVSNLYLGSINHTLLTLEALRKRDLPIEGIIFNGTPNYESERIILHHAMLPVLLRIQPEKTITPGIVAKYASQLNTLAI